jgi:hypothetical protein
MRYNLRTLLILLAVGPPVLAGVCLRFVELTVIAVCLAFVWLLAELIFRLTVRLEPPTE